MKQDIYLGQRFRDKVTGFTGIAVKRHTSITGSVQYTLVGEFSPETQNYSEFLIPEEILEFVDNGIYVPNDLPDIYKDFK